MEITLKSVQRILANYVLHYPEAGQNGESLVVLANDYYEDLRDENISDELFLIAAKNARKVCRFFPKIADIMIEVAKAGEKMAMSQNIVLPDLDEVRRLKNIKKETPCSQTHH